MAASGDSAPAQIACSGAPQQAGLALVRYPALGWSRSRTVPPGEPSSVLSVEQVDQKLVKIGLLPDPTNSQVIEHLQGGGCLCPADSFVSPCPTKAAVESAIAMRLPAGHPENPHGPRRVDPNDKVGYSEALRLDCTVVPVEDPSRLPYESRVD